LPAEESVDDIRSMIDEGTELCFATSCMGGGTGSGAALVEVESATIPVP